MFTRRSCRQLCALALMLLASLAAQAQRQAPESELKAAILINLLLFVDWRGQGAQPQDHLRVCYLEAGPVASALAPFDGKPLKGRPLRVMRVEPAQAGGCHLLYVSPLEAGYLPQLAPAMQKGGVLLVGDSADYLQRGVMLNLAVDGGRVVFDIDFNNTRLAGLTVSSKVLRLARHVQTD